MEGRLCARASMQDGLCACLQCPGLPLARTNVTGDRLPHSPGRCILAAECRCEDGLMGQMYDDNIYKTTTKGERWILRAEFSAARPEFDS
jgi:hypothetical protein